MKILDETITEGDRILLEEAAYLMEEAYMENIIPESRKEIRK